MNRPVTPGALLRALRRRWLLAVSLGLTLAIALATAAWALRPDKYTAFALVRVSASETKILPDATRVTDGGSYLRTQVALIRSRAVLRKAVQDPKINQLPIVQKQSDPVEWLEKELVVDQLQNTELVRVSMAARGSGATDIGPIVNAVIDAYMTEVIDAEQATQNRHLSDLHDAAKSVEAKLQTLRTRIQLLTGKLKGGDLKIQGIKQQTMLEEYSALKRELGGTNVRLRDLEIKIELYQLRLAPEVSRELTIPWAGTYTLKNTALDALVERELDADPRVFALETEASKLRAQLKQFEELGTNPNSPAKAALQGRLSAAEAAVKAAREERRQAATARNRALTDANLGQLIREAKAEHAALQKQQVALAKDVADLKIELDDLGVNSGALETARAEMDRSEQFLKALWDQIQRLEVELKGSLKRVKAEQNAEVATVLNKNGRAQESVGAGMLGLLAALFAVAILDVRRNHIHTLADVSRGLRLRVLGALPNAPGSRSGIGTLTLGPVQSKYARGLVESIDALRTTLLHTHSGGSGVVLMVTSSGPGEGKTTLATELAASLARARRRTVLVDCDLRAPSLHQLFGVVPVPGVCGVLAGTAGIDTALWTTEREHLSLLPAGELTLDVMAALAQRSAVQRLVDDLRSRFDFVIIDSSPLLLVPDALMVAGCVDGLLFSVRPGVSRSADVYAGYERLAEHHLPFLGVVVNGVPTTQSYERYGRPLSSTAPSVEESASKA